MKRFAAALLLLTVAGLAAGGELPGWAPSGPALTFRQNDLYGYIDGGAELFLEFGFNQLRVQKYRHGHQELVLETYRMQGPEAALGIYLCQRGRERPVAGVTARHTGDTFQIMALKGEFLVQVNNPEGAPGLLPAMTALLNLELAELPGLKPAPLFDRLPAAGKIPESELLIRGPFSLQRLYYFGEGDILNLNGEVFAVAADYAQPGHENSSLIVIVYPDAVQARAALTRLLEQRDPGLGIIRQTETRIVFRDFRQKYVLLEIGGNRLDIQVNLIAAPN